MWYKIVGTSFVRFVLTEGRIDGRTNRQLSHGYTVRCMQSHGKKYSLLLTEA